MFERYNERARRVVFYARNFASELGGQCIEPEHVLLAILEEEPDLFRTALSAEKGIDAFRAEVEGRARGPNRPPASEDLALSAASKRVLGHAAAEAERRNDREIRPSHLLTGLLREKDGAAAGLLRRHGIELQETNLVFVASSKGPAGGAADAAEVHRLIDELPNSQLGRARALLQALREASRSGKEPMG